MAKYLIESEDNYGNITRRWETDIFIVDDEYFFFDLEDAVERAKAISAWCCGNKEEGNTTCHIKHIEAVTVDEPYLSGDAFDTWDSSTHIGGGCILKTITFNEETMSWEISK